MSGDAALGIDVGTTNVKVVLVDGDGQVSATAHRQLSSHTDGDIGEQDASATWKAVSAAVREVTSGAAAVASDVGSIGVCSQYSSIVPVDEAGEPVAPMVMWTDKRGTDHSFELLMATDDAMETWVDRHGIPPVGGGLSLAHMLHLQRDRPDVHARTATWLESMDFVNMRLTGEIAANQGTMFMSELCDNRTLGVSEYDPLLVEMSTLDADRLPALRGFDEPVGNLSPAVAADLGLPADAVVYGGVNDTVAAAVATGAFRDGHGGLSIGTTSVLVDTLDDKHVDLDHELLSMPSPFPDTYVLWAENGIGGRALEHILTDVVHAVDVLADHTTDDEFARLDAALESVSAGSGGVMFLPWLNGSMSPANSPTMRGGFINMSIQTNRADMVRAVAEGVAHNLAWLLPYAETFTGKRMDEISFLGGAARSAQWCQILADVLGRPVGPVPNADWAVARGVADLARHRHGILDRSELEAGVPPAARFEPNASNRDLYDAKQEQFVAAFEALRPIHEALNS
ncbi:MAG: xylulokinase [Microthrixaceae bacterium]